MNNIDLQGKKLSEVHLSKVTKASVNRSIIIPEYEKPSQLSIANEVMDLRKESTSSSSIIPKGIQIWNIFL